MVTPSASSTPKAPLTGWIANTAPSLPAAPARPVVVDVGEGGFAFSTGGICLPVTAADMADLVSTLHLPLV
jgi:hypothetical protein